MSFLKSFRHSVSRKSSNLKNNTSVVTIGRSSGSLRRATEKKIGFKDDLQQEEQPEGVLRSNTFTVNYDESILVKVKSQSKTTSMFGKLSSFTRKKKQSPQKNEGQGANSYKSSNKLPQPTNDPFGVLYSTVTNAPMKSEIAKKSPVEYGTYRKSKLPTAIKEQLDEIKDVPEQSDDRDKFKTVTINSFRKSFREKFLNPKKEVPYNPAWFIEVDPPKSAANENENERSRSRDMIIFDNENYRPTAQSPVRESQQQQPIPKPRTTVKRNETFRVERDNTEQPSIRIEIKNSITPHQPGRIVPVGVAKPMPSSTAQQSERSSIIQRTWTEPDRNSTRNMYQTTIQITDGASYPTPKPRHIDTNPSSFKRNHTKIQISETTTPKNHFMSTYSPLTSYGMLKSINQSNKPTNQVSQRNKPFTTYRETSPTFESKKWSQSATIANKHKMTGFNNLDNSVRREVTNISRITSNARKPLSKAPWR